MGLIANDTEKRLLDDLAALRADNARLREALAYWMPDETLVPDDHRDAWNEHITLTAKEPAR